MSSKVYLVDNIAELKQIADPGDDVKVSGYYENGDGGGGDFYWFDDSQCTINNAGGYSASTGSFNVVALPEALFSGQVLEFENGATLTLSADASKSATTVSGTLSDTVQNGEQSGLADNGTTVIKPTYSGFNAIGRWKKDKIKYSFFIGSIEELKELDVSSFNNGQIVIVQNYLKNVSGGGNKSFYWDSTSTDSDNGRSIFEPTYTGFNGVGRWISVANTKQDRSVRDYGVQSNDDTTDVSSVLNDMFATGSRRGLIDGNFYVQCGQTVFPSFNSSRLEGRGGRFLGTLQPIDSTAGALITISSAGSSSFTSTLRDLAFKLENGTDQGCFLFEGRHNLINFDGISISDVGENGYALANTPTDTLFQEMYFRRFEVHGAGNTLYNNSFGMDIYPTGNVELIQCNIERVFTAIKARGREKSVLTIHGGHFERCRWFLDVDGVNVSALGVELGQGGIWLGDRVSNSNIQIQNNRSSQSLRRGVIDNGFGNEINFPSVTNDPTDIANSGIVKSGFEWLYASNVEPDPFFRTGFSGWNQNAGSKTLMRISAPKVNGRSILFEPSVANDYIEKTFTVDSSKEYVLALGLLFTETTRRDVKVQVYDSTGATLIHDSGTIEGIEDTGQDQMFKFWKVLLPREASGEYVVRIIAESADVTPILQTVVLSPSDINISDVTGEDSSTTLNGITSFTKDLSVGDLRFDPPTNKNSRMIVRFKATADGGSCTFSVNGDTNQDDAYGYFPLFTDTEREYCVVLPSYNDNLRMFSFSSGNVTLSEISVHEIPYDEEFTTLGGEIKGDISLPNNGHDENRLILGDNYIWVDAIGNLRIKSSEPTTDTDGTIVGNQT